jgi:hypothetical protein
MLKNIWEIENNPIFSLGASMRGTGDDVNNGAIQQLNQQSNGSGKKVLYNVNYQKLDLDSDDGDGEKNGA